MNYQSGEDADSGIKIYLREIGQIPLLTPEQEIDLAAKIKKGDAGARALMIRSNLRLVVKIAHDYGNLGMPLLDLISEGNIGLMKAVERFDPAKGGNQARPCQPKQNHPAPGAFGRQDLQNAAGVAPDE